MDEELTAIIIKGKVHRLTVIPDEEPCLCNECSLQELCDRLEERILCDFIGDYRGHHIFKRGKLAGMTNASNYMGICRMIWNDYKKMNNYGKKGTELV